MAGIKDLGNKIENEGATAQGRLAASEFNLIIDTLVDTVYAVAEDKEEYNTEYNIDGTVTI